MSAAEMPAGAAPDRTPDWHSIDWKKVWRTVRRLQARIVKAVREGRWNKVKALVYLLTHSYSGRATAILRVVSNSGARTPGVDGALWNTPESKSAAFTVLRRHGYRPQPLRRVYIPKSNGQRRGLGIPTMTDRAMQALYLLGLDPIAESQADGHSYGFRRERRCADALHQVHTLLSHRQGPQWILEGDIKACFDRISHDWLLTHVPMDRTLLGQWLKAGFLEKHAWFATREGTPQGGTMTPPTMLQTILLGATLKRGWADPIYDADFPLIDLHLLDQGSDDLPLRRPVWLAESFGNLPGEFLQLADQESQFRLLALLISFSDALLFQARKPLTRRADPRLEFGLLKKTFLVCINQSRNTSLNLIDQLCHLVHLPAVIGFRRLATAFVLDPNPSRLGEQVPNVLPDRGIQQVSADLLVPA